MKLTQIKKTYGASKLSSEKGLTLVEIIIVLIILAVLMSFLGSRIFGMGDTARAELTRVKMQDLKQKIFMYQMRNNTFPTDVSSFVANEDDGKDAWGTPIQYRALDNGRAYELKSPGADRKDGGSGADEDIVIKGP